MSRHLPSSTRAALRTAAAEVRLLFSGMHDAYWDVHERALAVAREIGILVEHAVPDVAESFDIEGLPKRPNPQHAPTHHLRFDLCRGGHLMLTWSVDDDEDATFLDAFVVGDDAIVTVADIERVVADVVEKIERALGGRARANIGRSRAAARTLQGVVDILGASRGGTPA